MLIPSAPQLVPGGRTVQAVPRNATVFKNILLAVTPKRGAVSAELHTTAHSVRMNVMPASSVRAASSHVTVQVGDRVTPGPESAASGVLQDSTEIDVSTPAKLGAMDRTVIGPVTVEERLVIPQPDSASVPLGRRDTPVRKSVLQGTMDQAASCTAHANPMPPVTHRPDSVSALRAKQATTVQRSSLPFIACESGYWGRGCVTKCQCRDDSLGCDPVSGQCVCETGFTGDHCEKRCVNGSYGQGCIQQCQCQNGAHCDHEESGRGLRREKDQISAVHLFHGIKMTFQCLLLCGQFSSTLWLMSRNPCDGLLEDSRSSCLRRKHCFTERSCGAAADAEHFAFRTLNANARVCALPSEACSEGFFGEGCERRCDCVHGPSCHHVTGRCECEPGWRGARCDRRCRAGTFGPNCKSRCSCINGGRCDSRTGTCYCAPGFIGADCSSSCLSGYYGKDCGKPCSCGEGGQCHPTTGRCICAPGRMGQSCEQAAQLDCERGFPALLGPNVLFSLDSGTDADVPLSRSC
ncbi:hypothetical protein F2P81_017331 [Scophthalmus maximus]|uniref:EGF-like domain-containing protein n=1 Tax=Scophthalmus maximus TaxID=52904 RepID=A0A6A4SFG5_SCOMX|nr:hypothetical protein F2P81_017331 [Scophthalmus maximus]